MIMPALPNDTETGNSQNYGNPECKYAQQTAEECRYEQTGNHDTEAH